MRFIKAFSGIIVSFLLIVASSLTLKTIIMDEPLINDTFDDGINEEIWQIVNDEAATISYLGYSGTFRYEDATGVEEVLMTTQPLTTGEGVVGYEVEFDFLYKTNDWGDWFAFTFYKTSVGKGLNWGASGYILNRTTSMQTVHSLDTAAVGGTLAPFETMTPHIPSISNQNIRFRFVYNNANKTAELYYDLVSETMDLTTLRNTFTFGGLAVEGAYHFGIISSGKGFYELDNLKIRKLTNTEPIVYLDENFETENLPEEISVIDASKFSYGPAKKVELKNPTLGAMFLTKKPIIVDSRTNKKISIKYDLDVQSLDIGGITSFVYGLKTNSSLLTDEGVMQIYFVNRDLDGIPTTHIGALKGNGIEVVQVLPEKTLGLNLANQGEIKVSLEFVEFNNVEISLLGKKYIVKGTDEIGLIGFSGNTGSHVLIDNFESTKAVYIDQSDAPDIYENFNTGYLNPEELEIYNYKDLKLNTEIPLVPTTKGIHLSNGKLIYDIASESARLITKHKYGNVEVRFRLTDYNIPITELNEEGEVDGVEIPPTVYVALSFGYETTNQNFWNVPTIIFQSKDGVAVIYALNMNDSTIYPIDSALLLNQHEEEFEFKVVALNGKIDIYMKRSSDPMAIFDGEPLLTYNDINTYGRVAIASSALGSFKIDDLSIVKIGGSYDVPIIQDTIDPSKLIAPEITITSGKEVQFEAGSQETIDFKTYFQATDNGTNIEITDAMIDTGGFDINVAGNYTITLTIIDEDGNEAVESIVVSVYPKYEAPEAPILPKISLVSGKKVQFETGSQETIDFKTYFQAKVNGVNVEITDEMIDNGGFDINITGNYTITLTVDDGEGNEAVEKVVVSVYPKAETPEAPEAPEAPTPKKSNTLLISIIVGVTSLMVGFGIGYLILKKVKKV